jgi:hypothetical protein
MLVKSQSCQDGGRCALASRNTHANIVKCLVLFTSTWQRTTLRMQQTELLPWMPPNDLSLLLKPRAC